MQFQWDEQKNRINIAKHGISFETARRIFDGFTLSAPDVRKDYGETRTLSLGRIDTTLLILVVSTDRNGQTRIISARRANKKERALYEAAVQEASDS